SSSDPIQVTASSSGDSAQLSSQDNTGSVALAGATGAAGASPSGTSAPPTTSTSTTDPSETIATPTSATLPSLDPAAVPGSGPSPPSPATWTISIDASAHTISVVADTTDVSVTVDGVTTSRPLAQVTSLSITSGAGNDSFTIGAISIPVALDGGEGTDTLYGPAADTTWSVTGAGAGTVGSVAFAGFENLAGAPDNQDTFVVKASASLSGVLDGGPAGFDTLVINAGGASTIESTALDAHSGTITVDHRTIAYAGLEPTVVNPGTATDAVFTLTGGADTAVLED